MSAVEDLITIATLWPHLQDAADARPVTTWPPTMGVSLLLDAEARESRDAALREERADSNPDAPGPRPTPVDIDVLDVMTTVAEGLSTTAEWLASRVQRPPVAAPPMGRGWTDAAHREAVLLAARDAADAHRWQFRGLVAPAPVSAEWLHARLVREGADDGPFRTVTADELDAVEHIARMGAELVRRALGSARRVTPVPHPCPAPCGGRLQVEGGDGRDPLVRCRKCGRTWVDTPSDAA